MSEHVGKFTVKDSTTLHKGNPQPHDISGTAEPESQPDYAGGRTAKNTKLPGWDNENAGFRKKGGGE